MISTRKHYASPYVGNGKKADTSIRSIDSALFVEPVEQLDELLRPSLNYAELLSDIREHGQEEPCMMFGCHLIDGRQRWLVCRSLGIPVIVQQSSLEELADAQLELIRIHPERVDKGGWAWANLQDYLAESKPAAMRKAEKRIERERADARAEEKLTKENDDYETTNK